MSGYDAYGSGGFAGNNMDSRNMMMMGAGDNGMSAQGMTQQGQSLDDIVTQNEKMMRRQSMPQYGRPSSQQQQQGESGIRRMSSMMEFSGGTPAGPLENYDFDSSATLQQESMNHAPVTMQSSRQNSDMQGDGNFGINNQYGSLTSAPSKYQSPAHPNSSIDMGVNSPFVGGPMGMSMDFSNDSGLAGVMASDQQQMSAYSQQSPYNTSMMNSPMNPPSMNTSMKTPMQEQGGNSAYDGRRSQYDGSQGSKRTTPDQLRNTPRGQSYLSSPHHTSGRQSQNSQMSGQSQQMSQHSQNTPTNASHSRNNTRGQGFPAQPQNPVRGSQQDKGMNQPKPPNEFDPANYNPNNQNFPWEAGEGGWPSTMVGKPHMHSSYKNAYSSTGFDMLGVLMRVATRPNPEINLGSVDLSCAFVVCDAEKDDFPIIYCSDNFERLTGYTRHMTLGRNCRFLQSPDGNVEPGVRRKYVDDNSVLYLKNMINLRREAQISLINYRRGGQPFMNLLTMIPISWETDQVKFFVGFQVDLVEQPNAVTSRNPDGSYSVNYQRGMTMPRYVMNAPESTTKAELGQTVPRDDVSAILSTIGTGESEYAKRMWDKVLLENTDDVVHVLSLKGLFQWVSPSAQKVLEYEPGEIIGTALSSICHPSDIVPVTRDLKDTSTGASVNVVFRIRRKVSGYMWFEGHGSLHTEQGKGRKSIILVGRERPVYAISKKDIISNGGVGENELWTKMSTSGMFLFISSNVRQLLDRTPEEMVGVSIQSLMRSESKQDFGRILEHARTGKKASVKHEVINRRGQVLQAFTTLYPGDATEGLKPTFIVAQTRLIKYARNNPTSKPSVFPKIERGDSNASSANDQQLTGGGTPGGGSSVMSNNGMYVATDTAVATYAGQNGLRLGHQDVSLASEDNLFEELKTTKSSSWQYEIRQLEKRNRLLAEEVQSLLAAKKKRKRRKGAGQMQKDCANCHTRVTPEWRRGPSGQRDLCNSCGLRWAKLNGRVSPRTSSQQSAASDKASKASISPRNSISMPKSDSGGPTGSGPSTHQTPSHGQSGRGAMKVLPHNREGHAAQMEGAEGVPEKIDEGIEPD